MTPGPKEDADLYEQMMDAMVPHVQQHVVAIAAWYGDELHQHATGSLVKFSDHHFLVTAAHAIEDFDTGRKHYPDIQLLVDNGNANQLVPLYGPYRATLKARDRERPRLVLDGERDDLFDIGVWELDPITVELLTAKRFLNRTDIAITEDLSDGIYFMAGCPCVWATADTATRSASWKWLKLATFPYPSPNELLHFDERFHVAYGLDDGPELPDRFEGISGCPIWKLSDLPVPEDWSPDRARIIAIQTHVYSKIPHKAIRGTQWRHVLPVLTGLSPDVREGFRLWLPGTN